MKNVELKENIMTLKKSCLIKGQEKNMYELVGRAENYVQLFDTIEQKRGCTWSDAYFLINVSGEEKVFPCGVRHLVMFWRQIG